MTWGVVRVGDRYAAIERHADGSREYTCAPRLREYGGALYRGPLDEARRRASTFPTEAGAVRDVARRNRRPYDREGDRWAHLDAR